MESKLSNDLSNNIVDNMTRLQWSCRRGMLELDILLGNFLQDKYKSLSIEEKYNFIQLLNSTDPQLFTWLMGSNFPPLIFRTSFRRFEGMLNTRSVNFSITLQPSKLYTTCLFIMIILSLVSLLLTDLPIYMQLIIGLLALLYTYSLFLKNDYKSRTFLQTLKLLDYRTNQWQLSTKEATYIAHLRHDSTVTEGLSILRFKVTGKFWPISYVVFKDAVNNNQYRQLLVVLHLAYQRFTG